MQFTSAGMLNRWGTMDTEAVTSRNWRAKNRRASHNAYGDPVVLWNYPRSITPAPAPSPGPHIFTERGYPVGDTTYAPPAGTLFYAIDLNITDQAAADALYGDINTWQFDFSGDLKDFSDLFSFSLNVLGRTPNIVSFNKNISNWDVSGVTSMKSMFNNCTGFNQNIGSWDVSNVEIMEGMFYGADSFDKNINGWNVGKVTDMNSMFRSAITFDQDISGWDVSKVTDMNSMFRSAISFNQDINDWDVGKVTDMNNLFLGATSFNQNITGWDVSKVSNMDQLLFGATIFNQDIGSWNVSKVTTMNSMFRNATNFNQDISSWDVSEVTDMSSMFRNTTDMSQNIWAWDVCGNATFDDIFLDSSMIHVPNNDGYLPDKDASANGGGAGSWFTSPYTFTQRGWTSGTAYTPVAGTLFYAVDLYSNDASRNDAISLYGHINTWQFDYNAIGGDLKNLSYLFDPSLGELSTWRPTDVSGFNFDINNWDVSGVTDMSRMFNNTTGFNKNIGSWQVGSVTNMKNMFVGANVFDNSGSSSINNWNVSNVANMDGMFLGASSFNQDIGNWQVDNVVTIKNMFHGASSFNQDISGWNVSNVNDMYGVFTNASSFNQPLNDWNVSNAIYIYRMFYGASSFDQPLDNWVLGENVKTLELMFSNTPFNQDISTWDVSGITSMDAMFQGAAAFNQNISGWNVSNVTNFNNMFKYATDMSQNIWAWDVCGNATFTNIFLDSSMIHVPNNDGYLPDKDASANGGGAGSWFTSPYTFTQRGWTSGTAYTPVAGTLFYAVDLYSNDASRNDAISLYGHINTWQFDYSGDLKDFSQLFDYTADSSSRPSDVSGFNFDIGNWNVSGVTNMQGVFVLTNTFNQNLSNWDTGNVTNMKQAFYLAKGFNNGENSGGTTAPLTWDTTNVLDMQQMLGKTDIFNQDISSWNVSNVGKMRGMFQDSVFNRDINNWDVGNVTDMFEMFQDNSVFNQDISGWNVSNVTLMKDMFNGASNMSQNIYVWDVDGVRNAGGGFRFTDIFASSAMTSVTNADGDTPNNNAEATSTPGDWFTGPVPYTFTERGWISGTIPYAPAAGTLFYAVDLYSNDASRNQAIALYGNINTWQFDYNASVAAGESLKDFSELFRMNILPLTRPSYVSDFNEDISNWDVSGVTDMREMFYQASNFNQDINGWNVSAVTTFYRMFLSASSFNQPLGNWDTGAVLDMADMFDGASSFDQPIGNWDVGGVTTMREMFKGSNFNQDISGWNVNNVTNMQQMFRSATDMSQNIWVWDVCGNADFDNIFLDSSMIHVPNNLGFLPDEDASANGGGAGSWFTGPAPYTFTSRGWDGTSSYAPAEGTLFYAVDLYSNDASNSQAISLYGNINTWQFDYNANSGELKDFSELFYCDADSARPEDVSGFNFDISGWDVSEVTNMERMFSDANVFNQNLSNWNTSNVNNMTAMFQYAKSFNNSGVALTWNTSNVTNMTAMFDGYKYRLEGGNQFNQDIGGWDVGNVVEMAAMFQYAPAFNQDIGGWNVGNVTDMTLMFRNSGGAIPSGSFNQDITGWNVGNVTNISSMFRYQTDMSQNIWAWDVCGNANFQNIFYGATAMLTVSNNNGETPNVDACGNSAAGDWFTGPYTFTQRGWNDTDSTYNPAADTLFYAVDLYSNDASNSQAISLYGPINTWRFDYTGDLKNLSELFRYNPDGFTRPTDVSGFNFDIGNWDVSGVTDMKSMFQKTNTFNQNIGSWSVGNVVNMDSMFENATSFNQDIGNWDVGNVTNMKEMFYFSLQAPYGSYSLGPGPGWNVSNVTDMNAMFRSTDFNTDISGWNVSNVINMKEMFWNAEDFDQPLNNWNVSNVTDMYGMFRNTTKFNQDIGNWNVSKVTDMTNMFRSASEFNQDISGWDMSGVMIMNNMFRSATDMSQNIWAWDVCGNATFDDIFLDSSMIHVQNPAGETPNIDACGNSAAGDWFRFPYTFTERGWTSGTAYTPAVDTLFYAVDLYSNDASNSQAISLYGPINTWQFDYSGNLKDLSELFRYNPDGVTALSPTRPTDVSGFNFDIGNWDVSGVTDMKSMFHNAKTFDQNIGSWSVGNVNNMELMFRDAEDFDKDIGNWDVGNVTNMKEMFFGAKLFDQNINGWNVSNVTTMQQMFRALDFNQDISSWNVSNVIDMKEMFYANQSFNNGDTAQNSLKPLTWNVSNVTTMSSMFRDANNFNQDIGNWNVSKVTDMNRMFMGASNFNQDISGWDMSGVIIMNNMFRSATDISKNIWAWDVCGNADFDDIFRDATAMLTVQNPAGETPNIDACGNSAAGDWFRFPYTFTERGWTSGTAYTPAVDTLFYAVDLYSNDASNSQAISLYGPINTWQFDYTGNLKDLSELFRYNPDGVTALSPTRPTDVSGFNFDIGNWDVSGVTDMKSMFHNAKTFDQNIGSWSVGNVNNMELMFRDAEDFDKDIGNWDVGNVTNMKEMFFGAKLFDQNINGWNVSNVTTMQQMFRALDFNQDISSWNVSNVIDMKEMFYANQSFNNGDTAQNSLKPLTWNVSNVTTMSSMFRDANNFNQDIGNWNVSKVTDMNRMFMGASNFNQDISGWDMSGVMIMNNMFRSAADISQNIWAWDVCGNADFDDIFRDATAMLTVQNPTGETPNIDACGNSAAGDWFRFPYTFTERGWTSGTAYTPAVDTLFYAVDLYSNDASNSQAISLYGPINTWQFDYSGDLKDFSQLFDYTADSSSRPSDVSGFNFDIGNWNVSGVTNMQGVFVLTNTFNQNLSNWDTGNVTNMKQAFYLAKGFNNGENSGGTTAPLTWDTTNVLDMQQMLGKTDIFNQDISGWNVSNVGKMRGMFQDSVFNRDINNWDVGNVTDMFEMFRDNSVFNQDISGWNVSNVTLMKDMFNGASNMSQNIYVWDVDGVRNAGGGFRFTDIFASSAMTSVTNADGDTPNNNAEATSTPGDWFTGPPYTFTQRGWTSGTYDPSEGTLFYAVDLYSNDASRNEAILAYGNINSWQFDYTGDLKDFSDLFYCDADSARPSDVSGFNFVISGWDVSGVTNMKRMFGDANVFNQNLSNWNTSNVNNMTTMFQYAKSFNNSGVALTWNTSNVTNMTAMFDGYKYRLEGGNQFNQDIGSWDVGNVVEMAAMFQYAPAFNQDIGGWNVGNVTDMTLMFRNHGTGPGSFNQDISGWNVSNVTNMSSMFFNQTDMSQNIWAWDVCGNATFTNIFYLATKMQTVPNSNGNTPTDNAAENGVSGSNDGDWFTGP